MTDYNDGEWHGWNGGACPVHPESVVDVKFNDGEEYKGQEAWGWDWKARLKKIIAFRVTKHYVEPTKPREFWINFYADAIGSPYSVFENEQRAIDYAQNGLTQRIHVREVIEE